MNDSGNNSIKVQVKFYGYLADYTATSKIELEIPGCISLSECIKMICARFPLAFLTDRMDTQDDLSLIKVFRNSELITPEMEAQLVKEGDELRFFSAISGG